jgi:hypothetical protein
MTPLRGVGSSAVTMGVGTSAAPDHRRRRAAVSPFQAILVATVLGVAGALGVVAWGAVSHSGSGALSHPGYSPFNVGSGMLIPTPGNTSNTSPNATIYANGSVVFTATASGCVAPYSFTWIFGDGTQSKVANVTHVYTGPGYYPGSLTVDDSAGHQSQSYFCVDASHWPVLGGGSGNPAPPCP